jgi:hypothetical protein
VIVERSQRFHHSVASRRLSLVVRGVVDNLLPRPVADAIERTVTGGWCGLRSATGLNVMNDPRVSAILLRHSACDLTVAVDDNPSILVAAIFDTDRCRTWPRGNAFVTTSSSVAPTTRISGDRRTSPSRQSRTASFTRATARVVVAAVRSDLNEHPEQVANQRLDQYLEALQAWLVAYPPPYVDAGRAVEDIGARFFADALLAARSGRITFGSVKSATFVGQGRST